MPDVCTILEYESFDRSKLHQADFEELKAIADTSSVLRIMPKGGVAATSHVGVITTKRGTVVEILPKIHLDANAPDLETTKCVFLEMLRSWNWRRFREKKFPESSIRALRRFSMLEVFIRQFLDNLNTLARGGLARRYVPVEENLPYLRGRLLFREQIRENLTNQARFYVAHDELSVNRPANRLIRSALAKLPSLVRNSENRRLLQLLHQFMEAADVPQSADLHADWQRHQVDRSMPHYGPVMQWVELFLFGQGLTTYSGRHRNLSLLFPMEQVFEDFVTHSFQRYQLDYLVYPQLSKTPLATRIYGPTEFQYRFMMKPDILLRETELNGTVYILDAKWKEIRWKEGAANGWKRRIDQNDLYQLYAYAKGYGCKAVALVFPQTRTFTTETNLQYRFPDNVPLLCLPFDVTDPQESVRHSIAALTSA